MNSPLKIVVSDLDGTLLPSGGTISKTNKETLHRLKKHNIIRVVATGRTLYSALSVLSADFPIDYLIFSSGAGIMQWKNKKIICSQKLEANEVFKISKILVNHNVDFMILDTIPQNHQFWYFQTGKKNPDFSRRLSLYKEFSTPIGSIEDTNRNASQLLIILPNNIQYFKKLEQKFTNLKVIRATSPLDQESIWMEIFPKNISKGHSSEWLCKKLNIPQEKSMGIGNDYNDIDLLEWSKHSYVVANAPAQLKANYEPSKSDSEDGFAFAVKKIVGEI